MHGSHQRQLAACRKTLVDTFEAKLSRKQAAYERSLQQRDQQIAELQERLHVMETRVNTEENELQALLLARLIELGDARARCDELEHKLATAEEAAKDAQEQVRTLTERARRIPVVKPSASWSTCATSTVVRNLDSQLREAVAAADMELGDNGVAVLDVNRNYRQVARPRAVIINTDGAATPVLRSQYY